MNIFKRIKNFTGENTDEFLAFSFAFFGESLIKSAEKEVFRPSKISSTHYNVLCTLAVQSPRPASEISSFILGSAANFSAILGRMEKEGLIEREVSKEDRREIFVTWTEKGKESFLSVRKKFQQYFKERFSAFSDKQKFELEKMLMEHLSHL